MTNKLTKTIIISTLLMLMSAPVFAVTDTAENTEQTAVEQTQTNNQAEQTTVDVVQPDENTVSSEPTITEQVQADVDNSVKMPPKSELKHVLGKFLKTMLLVIGSCIAIVLLLLGYKRLKAPKTINHSDIDVHKNLNSPETIEEATRFFIEKF